MKFAIIGAGGYIGTWLGARLRAEGTAVVAYSSSQPGGIDAASGLFDAGFALPRGLDAVIYLAQSPWSAHGASHAPHVLSVNVLAAVQAAAAAVAAGCGRFLYASTGNVYKPSFAPRAEHDELTVSNWYALSKVQAEQALARFAAEIDVHVLRLFGVYGPRQTGRLVPSLIGKVRNREPIFLDRGMAPEDPGTGLRLSLTYIADVVECLRAVAQRGGPAVMNVASDEVLGIRDIAMAIGGVLGIDPVFERRAQRRDGDLVADNRLLRQALAPVFTAFDPGIRATLEACAPAA